MDIAVLFLLMGGCMVISVPIGIALGIATAVSMWFFSDMPLIMISQYCFTSIDSFPLLAIPYFTLAGNLMGGSGISKRLVHFAESLVGFIAGGLAMVTVTACMFFAAISGSGPATVSAIGSFMIPQMKEKKYSGPFAAALAAAAGSIGVIIPPSIPFVLYGVITGASISEMFLAGIIPGLMMGFTLMIACYFIAKKRNYPVAVDHFSLKAVFSSLRHSFWALLVPVIIMGGIYGGVFTPTEAAVAGVAYALLIGFLIHKELTFKGLVDALRETVIVTGAGTFLLGLSMSFAMYLTIEGIPMRIGAWIVAFSSSKEVVLFMILAFLLLVGCFIDNLSSMIILTPIFLPVVRQFGIDTIHFGLFLVMALAIGFVTPPFGANLFVASTVSGEKIDAIAANSMIFVAAMVAVLLVVAYVPWFSMVLVNMSRGL
ncbi:MAG: TRAP transporter large permease [Synergistaceae bacterium]|jgi:C4-dicarboxylate transporter DctM subunit|nr:TRAP transporter large permease [Synergistaceae bacterium]